MPTATTTATNAASGVIETEPTPPSNHEQRPRGPTHGVHFNGQLRNAQDQAHPQLVRGTARWHVDFTPTSASWINQVECFFALLTERALKRGVFRSFGDLEQAIKAYIDATNADPKPFRRTKTADDILASIQRFCLRTRSRGIEPSEFQNQDNYWLGRDG